MKMYLFRPTNPQEREMEKYAVRKGYGISYDDWKAELDGVGNG